MVTLAVLVVLLAALGAAAARWGADTRDGRDWQALHEPVPAPWLPGLGYGGVLRSPAERHAVRAGDPAEEEFLHWCARGAEPRLHGVVLPPREWRGNAPRPRCCYEAEHRRA